METEASGAHGSQKCSAAHSPGSWKTLATMSPAPLQSMASASGDQAINVYYTPSVHSALGSKRVLVWLGREDVHIGHQEQDKTGCALTVISPVVNFLFLLFHLQLVMSRFAGYWTVPCIQFFHPLLLTYSFLPQMFTVLIIYSLDLIVFEWVIWPMVQKCTEERPPASLRAGEKGRLVLCSAFGPVCTLFQVPPLPI